MKGELGVTWHFCLGECVGSDTRRQICCHQRGDVRFGKSAVLQKGTKFLESVQTWWNPTKRSKFAMYNASATFWPKAAAAKGFSSSYVFYFLLGHLSSTGVEEYKRELICIKPYNLKSYENPECRCHQDPLTFSAKNTQTSRAPFPQGDQAFAGGASHVSQWSPRECHTASTLTQSPLTPSPLAQSLLPGPPQLLWLRRM